MTPQNPLDTQSTWCNLQQSINEQGAFESFNLDQTYWDSLPEACQESSNMTLCLWLTGGKDKALVVSVPVQLGSDGVLSLIFFGTVDEATVAGGHSADTVNKHLIPDNAKTL